jgi:hypothetical protein
VVALQAYSVDGFYVANSLERYDFMRDAKGEVSAVMQFVGDEKFVNQRIGAVPPARRYRLLELPSMRGSGATSSYRASRSASPAKASVSLRRPPAS